MISIKIVKGLTTIELNEITKLINTYYTNIRLNDNEIIIYSKNGDIITGCITIDKKKDISICNNLCVKVEYWNMEIDKQLIETAKTISGTSLYVEIEDNNTNYSYYIKGGFSHVSDNILILRK